MSRINSDGNVPSVRVGSVNGPAALVAAVRKAGGSWNPATARKEYADNVDAWQLYLDLLELDGAKLANLVDRHGDTTTEPDTKYQARQKMAVVFNLIPSIIAMITGYLTAEEPVLADGGDADLKAFLANCDGQGTPFKEWVRHRGLPLSLVMGHCDVLVQNPFTDAPAETQAGAEKTTPAVYAITPLQRINWSTRTTGEYNWICFKDAASEDANPFSRNTVTTEAYITVSAANPELTGGLAGGGGRAGFWVRSWEGFASGPQAQTAAGNPVRAWHHVAGYTPTERCAIATLYYRQSVDPRRRHEGVSKIAMMAVLTRAILNILSWTQEDILANLALFAVPSKNGKPPLDPQTGAPREVVLSPFTILWYDNDAGGEPKVVQGAVDHIKVKMEFVAALVHEILRLASMVSLGSASAAEGTAVKVQSGVAGMVERTELHQELGQIATGLDAFTWDIYALAKSWATGEDWDAARVRKDIPSAAASWHKGPYTLDPLADVINNSKAVLGMFAPISPAMSEAALRYVARAYLYANDPALATVIKEITAFGKSPEAESGYRAAAAEPLPGGAVPTAGVDSELATVGTRPAGNQTAAA